MKWSKLGSFDVVCTFRVSTHHYLRGSQLSLALLPPSRSLLVNDFVIHANNVLREKKMSL